MLLLKRLIYTILLTLWLPVAANAQIAFSDSTSISLLTCSIGADSYERFGHTGVRIYDFKTKQDIVFHWGVYDFNAPHFVLKFIKGITDYQIGASYTENFIGQYYRRGLGVSEQVLDLDKSQKNMAIAAILENYRPENRCYRYSYLFDNCATRPFDVINAATGGSIVYDSTWVKPVTLRDMLQEKTGKNNWLDFGISLAVAVRSDQTASFREQMFLPDHLAQAYANASIDGHKLVKGKPIELLRTTPEIQAKIDDMPTLLSPNMVFGALLVFMLIIVYFDNKKHSPRLHMLLKIATCTILLGTGITGSIIWFLNFFSLHPAVDHNVNCLWLLPTNIVFAALIWVKSAQKVNRIYFFIIFALIIAYVIINIGFVHQYFNPAFLPLLATIVLICCQQTKELCFLKNKHEEKLI